MKKSDKKKESSFEKFASKATRATGSTAAFCIAFLIVVIWAISGPIFNYSETWQLVINTGTTIITFLMVFLIQKAQNKEGLALQLKLNELVAAHEFASNRLIDIEDLSEEEMLAVRKYYEKLSRLSGKEGSLQKSHSIDEAEDNQENKTAVSRKRKSQPAESKKPTTKVAKPKVAKPKLAKPK